MTDRLDADSRSGMVVVLNRDVMARIRIADLLRQLGYEPQFVRDSAAFATALASDSARITLGIIDMNAPVDWDQIAALAAIANRPPLLGFGPHVDVAGRRAAKAAGVDRIVANGEFHRDAAALIRRYARSATTGGG